MKPNNKEFSFHDYDENFIKENKKELQNRKEEIWKLIQNRKKKTFVLNPYWTVMRYAAILIIGIGIGYWIHFFSKNQNHTPSSDIALQKNETTFLTNQNDSITTIHSIAITSVDTTSRITNSATIFSSKKNINTFNHSLPVKDTQEVIISMDLHSNTEITMEKENFLKKEIEYTSTNSESIKPKVIHIQDVYTSPTSKQDNALSKLDKIHLHSSSEYHSQTFHLLFKQF